MPRAIIFTTPGLIDIRSFTTFGLSAKPNSTNPIGFFGTGLKYAIAVLVRSGAEPIVYIGKDRYQFYKRKTNFRGKDFDLIRMKKQKWNFRRQNHIDLPYSTEYGKNWELWQAYRELETNTHDENGTTDIYTGKEATSLDAYLSRFRHNDTQTQIVIENEAFVQCYLDRDSTFLSNALTQREGNDRLQILEGQSKHLYYRGMRIADLPKPAQFTYNILSVIDLTEDRTLKYDFQAESEIARYISSCKDQALVTKVVTAPEQYYEHGLDFSYVYEAPSEEFKSALAKLKKSEHVHTSAFRYYSSYIKDEEEVIEPTIWDRCPLPWRTDGTYIIDDNGNFILTNALDKDISLTSDDLETIVKAINDGAEV